MQIIVLTVACAVSCALGATTKILKKFDSCGSDIHGACTKGTFCSAGTPSICLPDSAMFRNETAIKRVYGHGMAQAADIPARPNADPIPVWWGCTDSFFSGECLAYSVACDFCISLAGTQWDNQLSSLELLADDIVGCVFWSEPECWGTGIVLEYGAIPNLGGDPMNDAISAFSCFLH